MAKAKRPKPIGVGKVRIRVHRGPADDGRWYWRADREENGARPVVWRGWGTPAEATQAVIDLLAEGGEIEPAPRVQVRTVADLLDVWTASQEDRVDVTAITKRNAKGASARLAGEIGSVLVERVDRHVLERYRDRCGDAGATVARELKYSRQAWRWGREVGSAPQRDLPSIRVQRKTPVRTRFTPTRGEAAAILAHIARHSLLARRGVILLAAAGLRPGELLSLRWGPKVAPDCAWLDVDGKMGERRVYLHPDVAAELRRWERVLGACVVTVSANTIRKHLAAATTALGLGRCSPTSLRRYVVDALYDAPGANLAANASQMGHSPATALGIYKSKQASKQQAAVVAAGLSIPLVEDNVIELATAKKKR